MSNGDKNYLIIQYLDYILKQINNSYPNLMGDGKLKKVKEMFLNRSEDYEQVIDEINEFVEKMLEGHNKNIEEDLKQNQSLNEIIENYQTINIQNIDISTFSYQQMDNYFYHYSLEKFLPFYDINGMKPVIGENSKGIDPEASIFFSKGIEGVLELWDVWLKWRLNRQNNPQYKGNTPEEIQNNMKRFQNGNISVSEKSGWYYWLENFKNGKCLEDNYIMEKLYNYEFNEMQNSYYFIIDLKENNEFTYDQVDIKKHWAIENAKRWQRDINPMTVKQYGKYSDFSTSKVDKWNMQTIPGKNILIEPNRIKRLNVDGKVDVYSIVKFMYDKYKKEVPKDKQVEFDILDKYVNYVDKSKVNKDSIQDKKQERYM